MNAHLPGDMKLTELLARKLAKEGGFDPEQMMVHAMPHLICGKQTVVQVKDAFPAWQCFVPVASSMIAVARSLNTEESNMLLGYRYV